MTIMGTGVAAAVAQVAQQSQQVAAGRDRRAADIRDEARRVREAFDAYVRAVDAGGAADEVHIDNELPDNPGPGPSLIDRFAHEEEDDPPADANDSSPVDRDGHIDIKI